MTATVTPTAWERGHEPATGGRVVGRPLWIVHGGPQADPLRRLLNAAPEAPYLVASTPSADRIGAEDLESLYRLIAQADAFICEPLPAGYLGHPVGLDDLRPRLRPGVPVITFPRIHYAGLHPYQVEPRAGSREIPPLVPYHDLRTVASVSGHSNRDKAWGESATAQVLRECAAWSLMRMRILESRTDIGVASLVRGAGATAVHTIDRPGDQLLLQIARGVQEALGVPPNAQDPGIHLAGQFRGPVSAQVADALGLPIPTRTGWLANSRDVTIEELDEVQARWYHDHPRVLRSVLAREHARMDLLGVI